MLGTEYPTFLSLQVYVFSFCTRGQWSWARGHRTIKFWELGFAYVLSTIPLLPKLLGKQRTGWKKRSKRGRTGIYFVFYLCPLCFQMLISVKWSCRDPKVPIRRPEKNSSCSSPLFMLKFTKNTRILITGGENCHSLTNGTQLTLGQNCGKE